MNCDYCDLALSLVWHRQESMQIGRMLLEQQAADLSDSELLADGAVPTHHSTVFHTMANIVKHLCFVHLCTCMHHPGCLFLISADAYSILQFRCGFEAQLKQQQQAQAMQARAQAMAGWDPTGRVPATSCDHL